MHSSSNGSEWGMGQIDQSHAQSFSHLPTPTDKTVALLLSHGPKSPLCHCQGMRQYHLWEECAVSIAFNNNAVHWQFPSPQPSPHLWPLLCPAHASYFQPWGAQTTQDNRTGGLLDILKCTFCWNSGHSTTALQRQNGERLNVVLIFTPLISVVCNWGVVVPMETMEKKI